MRGSGLISSLQSVRNLTLYYDVVLELVLLVRFIRRFLMFAFGSRLEY